MAAVTRTTNKEQMIRLAKHQLGTCITLFFKEQTNKEFDVCKKFEKYVVAKFLFFVTLSAPKAPESFPT